MGGWSMGEVQQGQGMGARMSHVRRWHLPSHVLCGDPPKRLISKLDVYVSGAVVGHGVGAKYIVFPSWTDALYAVRSTLEDASAWYGEDVETRDIPCTSCHRLVSRIDDHRPFCSTRKEFEKHHKGGVMLASVLAPSPVVEAAPVESRDLGATHEVDEAVKVDEVVEGSTDRDSDERNEELPEYPMEPEDRAPSQDVFVSPHEDTQPSLSTDPLFLKSLQEYVSEQKPEAPEIDPHVIDGAVVIDET